MFDVVTPTDEEIAQAIAALSADSSESGAEHDSRVAVLQAFEAIDDAASIAVAWDPSGFSDGAVFDFGAVPTAPVCHATDAGAPAPQLACVVTGYETTVGAHVLTGTVTDAAGRPVTASMTYEVKAWTISAFADPIRADQTVVKGNSTSGEAIR